MGMYDTVNVPCPKCGEVQGFQSKSGPCLLYEFDLSDCPGDVLADVNRHAPATCGKCGIRFWVGNKLVLSSEEWIDAQTPGREFVAKRLREMEANPKMWASTKESFGLQLAMLVEIHQIDRPEMQRLPTKLVIQKIFGPGNVVPNDPFDDEWAKKRVSIARFCMELP